MVFHVIFYQVVSRSFENNVFSFSSFFRKMLEKNEKILKNLQGCHISLSGFQ